MAYFEILHVDSLCFSSLLLHCSSPGKEIGCSKVWVRNIQLGQTFMRNLQLFLEQGYKYIKISTATHLNICFLLYSLLYSSQIHKLQIYILRSYQEV